MKKAMLIGFLALNVMSFQTAASAAPQEEIHAEGQVVSVDATGHVLTITHTDAAGKTDKVDMQVPAGTSFQGVPSLDKIEAGRQVKIDALRNPANANWETKTVTVV